MLIEFNGVPCRIIDVQSDEYLVDEYYGLSVEETGHCAEGVYQQYEIADGEVSLDTCMERIYSNKVMIGDKDDRKNIDMQFEKLIEMLSSYRSLQI